MDSEHPHLPQYSPSGRALSTATPILSSLQRNSAKQRAEKYPKSHSVSQIIQGTASQDQEGENPHPGRALRVIHPSGCLGQAVNRDPLALLFLLMGLKLSASDCKTCQAIAVPAAATTQLHLSPTEPRLGLEEDIVRHKVCVYCLL